MKVKEFLNAYYGNEEIAVEVADTDIMRSTGIFHIDEVGKLKENWLNAEVKNWHITTSEYRRPLLTIIIKWKSDLI